MPIPPMNVTKRAWATSYNPNWLPVGKYGNVTFCVICLFPTQADARDSTTPRRGRHFKCAIVKDFYFCVSDCWAEKIWITAPLPQAHSNPMNKFEETNKKKSKWFDICVTPSLKWLLNRFPTTITQPNRTPRPFPTRTSPSRRPLPLQNAHKHSNTAKSCKVLFGRGVELSRRQRFPPHRGPSSSSNPLVFVPRGLIAQGLTSWQLRQRRNNKNNNNNNQSDWLMIACGGKAKSRPDPVSCKRQNFVSVVKRVYRYTVTDECEWTRQNLWNR